jgi:serine/threonine protein kinase
MGAHAIGRFELQGEAGSGSAGTVYQALDRSSGARVAVKVLRGLAVADAARFARETRLLSQVHHPGVVRYVDQGTTDEGHAYLVMEWLDGEDLRRRLTRVGISVDETVQLARRVAEALAAIHAMGIVHRDLKPANIFLPGGSIADAKIIDFGLVHTEWSSVEVTRTGMVVGTPTYMSPEQARGQRIVDARADLFSLGCVIFKCLTGHAPFEGASVLAVLTKVLLDEAPRVLSLRPEVPQALDDLVARLTSKERSERPPNAATVARALAGIAPIGDLYDSVEPAPPSRLSTGLTTGEQRVSAVLLVGGSAGLRASSGREGSEREPIAAESATYASQRTVASPPSLAPSTVSAVAAVVEAHGGQLDNLLDGTQVVTLRTSGVATDQAARAARCALALRGALPDAPMAIATGRGEVGRRHTTGDAIERAALLLSCQIAALGAHDPPEIVMDAVTSALLDPRFDVVPGAASGTLSLLGMRAAHTPARPLLGRATPLVGREWEIGSIESIFRTCVDEGEARPLLVTAPAGMGKSRLAHEAVGILRRAFPETEVWWGRGDALRARTALGLLGQVVRSASGAGESEPPEDQRRRFAQRVATWLPGEPWVAEILGDVAGIAFPDDQSPALRAARREPRVMSESVREAWEALVAGATKAAPLIVVLEDLHWADAATVRFVGAALRSLELRPWLVLALARPEVHDTFPHLWEGRNLQEIRLLPLARRASERLARQVLGDRAGPDTIERIATQADGNAFYLEELIRAVAAARTVGPETQVGSPGSALPETVLAMVQARLEGLDASTRRVLRAASVFGQSFWAGGVDALLGQPGAQGGWASELVERELLAARPESRFPGERELAFRHALLREGAYATLTEADRVLGHALAGNWLAARGEPDSLVLAHHFDMALDETRAARHRMAAASSALRAADAGTAIACAERALAHADTEAMRVECLGLLCEAYAWRDDQGRALACALEVEKLAAPGSEPWLRATATKQSAALMLGRIEDVGSAIGALGAADPEPGTEATMATALTVTVFLLCFGLQIPMADMALVKLTAVSAAAGKDAALTLAPLELARSVLAAWARGDAWAALGHARIARRHGEAARDARHVSFARIFVGTSLWSLGQLAEAEAELRAVVAVSGYGLIGTTSTLYLALILIERGALDEARVLAQHRIDTGRADLARLGALREAEGHWLLGEIAAREGDPSTAEREILAGAEVLRPAVMLWHLAAARLVDVRLRRGAVREALALANELQAALAESGAHGLRGTLGRLLHAEALHASGDPDGARAALRVALDDLQARAARIDDAAARRRFLDDVPENARVVLLAREWLV